MSVDASRAEDDLILVFCLEVCFCLVVGSETFLYFRYSFCFVVVFGNLLSVVVWLDLACVV